MVSWVIYIRIEVLNSCTGMAVRVFHEYAARLRVKFVLSSTAKSVGELNPSVFFRI